MVYLVRFPPESHFETELSKPICGDFPDFLRDDSQRVGGGYNAYTVTWAELRGEYRVHTLYDRQSLPYPPCDTILVTMKTEQEFFASLAENDRLRGGSHSLSTPPYHPETYYRDIAQNPYFSSLVLLRHEIKRTIDFYMGEIAGAKNLDLFMLTPSISSPMGPGSDSEAIQIRFGELHTYLVDSSQFGFEPLIMNGIDRAYWYLPSMRGEDPD